MITKENKKVIIEKLRDIFTKSKSVAFVNFKGLSVAEVSNIRRVLRSEGVKYTVARKTLVKKVLDDVGIKGTRPELAGELAMAYLSVEAEANKDGDNLILPARSTYQFQKKMAEKIQIIGGVFDGEYKDKDYMLAIASIPSLSVLHGMFVNIINSPIQRFVIALNAVAQKRS